MIIYIYIYTYTLIIRENRIPNLWFAIQDILNILEYTFNLIYLTLLFFIKYFHNIIISYKNKHLTNLIIVN